MVEKAPEKMAPGEKAAEEKAMEGKATEEKAPEGKAAKPRQLPEMALLPGSEEFPRPAWLWEPLKELRDPAGKQPFQGLRGPQLAKIVPVTLLKRKGPAVLVSEEGAKPRGVAAGLTIPWNEGLLLLEEVVKQLGTSDAVVGTSDAITWHRKHVGTLEKERAKYKGSVISAAAYAKASVLNIAVTGPKVQDAAKKVWGYRRVLHDAAGEEEGPVDEEWKGKRITEYLPPWAAFCHAECGIYQDHYLVRWSPPLAEDGTNQPDESSAWEPDENLPARFDEARRAAKRKWLAAQQRYEGEVAEGFKRKRTTEVATLPAAAGAAAAGEEAEGSHALKHRRTSEAGPEAEKLFGCVVAFSNADSKAKNPDDHADFVWQIGKGKLSVQLIRLIDACKREERIKVTWKIARGLLHAANDGALTAQTRLATEAICELAQAKRYKLRVIEDIICERAKALGSDPSSSAVEGLRGAVAWVLVHSFPQKQGSSWGWSHFLWTWQTWWDFVARCLQGFEPGVAYTVLQTMCEVMVAQTGTPLKDIPPWSEDPARVRELRRRLCKTSGLTGAELLRELEHIGLDDGREGQAAEAAA
mmetsp:Transcript_75798/g.214304  ORF Transcript_75798/g.214304 Transcript_75798/m.214304 type:complete len:584 (-) Transcript_75798:190-1941(-)